jgi:hypothetical protein
MIYPSESLHIVLIIHLRKYPHDIDIWDKGEPIGPSNSKHLFLVKSLLKEKVPYVKPRFLTPEEPLLRFM